MSDPVPSNAVPSNAVASYPVELRLDAPLEVANWRPLVQWILAIPHLMIANVLGQIAGVLAVVSWFTILFTGRLPVGIAQFQCMVLRYEARAHSYAMWLHETYPPFEFDMAMADSGTDAVRIDITPKLENRDRLRVGLRFLWIIPIALFSALVSFAMVFALIGALLAVLFTGRWPEGLRRFVVGATRLSVRVRAYGRLLIDEYPPFSLS